MAVNYIAPWRRTSFATVGVHRRCTSVVFFDAKILCNGESRGFGIKNSAFTSGTIPVRHTLDGTSFVATLNTQHERGSSDLLEPADTIAITSQ